MDLYKFVIAAVFLVQCASWVSGEMKLNYKYLRSEHAFEIEISDDIQPQDAGRRYVAVAFGPNAIMQDAGGYFCTNTELKSFVIRELHTPPFTLPTLGGASLKSVSTDGGKLSCTFLRPISVLKTISDEKEYDFDFYKESYHILTATGYLSASGEMTYHQMRDVGMEKTDFPSIISAAYNQPIDQDQCSKNGKNCLKSGPCTINQPDCMFFSIRQIGDQFEIELSGGTGNGESYMAVAFAPENKMHDADLYYCTGKELRSAVIRKREVRPVDLNDTSIQVLKASTENGVGQCIFTRQACVRKEISSGLREDFDFLEDTYFILLASGKMSSDGRMLYHGNDTRLTTRGALPLGNSRNLDPHECVDVDLGKEVVDLTLCGISKNCVTFPDKCHPSSPDCLFFSFSQVGNDFVMELSGGVGNGKQYIAVGFAQSGDMQDADVYYCDGNDVRSAVIQTHYDPPTILTKSGSVTNVEAKTTNGIAHCRFTRPGCVIKEISGKEDHSFDLLKNGYHVLLALGNKNSGGGLSYHEKLRTVFASSDPLGAPDGNYECVEDKKQDFEIIDTARCDGLKECIRYPPQCSITSPDCAFFAYEQTEDTFTMELSGGIGNGKEYVAVTLAGSDAHNDALVYYCTGSELKTGYVKDNDVLNVKQTTNGSAEPEPTPEVTAEPSGSHRDKATTMSAGIVTLSSSTVDGVARCVFKVPSCIVASYDQVIKPFNLMRQKFAIFVQSGQLADGKPVLDADVPRVTKTLGERFEKANATRCSVIKISFQKDPNGEASVRANILAVLVLVLITRITLML